MRRYAHKLTGLLFAAFTALSVTSCYDVDNDREICDYKVQLRYDYNEENTAEANMIEYYVYTIDEYIFDEAGILFQHRLVTPDRCTEYMNSEIDLPPGRYSVIAVGNRDERSTPSDGATTRSAARAGAASPIPGVTRREDMLLTLQNCETLAGGTSGPSEKLYHGYKTFTVKKQGISRVRVDMINAHFSLKFRVTWKNGATPSRSGEYYTLLEQVPSEYSLMPEFIYPAGSFECKAHDCAADDLYPTNCNEVIHHIPHTCYGGNNSHIHRNDTRINGDNEMWGDFTSYRLKAGVGPKLRIFSTDGTRAGDDAQIVRDINLQAYFDWYEHNLDIELKQAYEIDIIIDGDKIILMPLNVADWDEGGPVN